MYATTTPRASTRVGVLWIAALTVLTLGMNAAPASAAELIPTGLRNNVGITYDPLSNANFDNNGYSYSSLLLRLEGLVPGDPVTSQGMTFVWPNTASAAKDNIATSEKVMPIATAPGITKLGFLGASTNGPITANVILNYSYTDAEGKPATLSVPTPMTFSDWTLNAGSRQPALGNVEVASTPFRVVENLEFEQVDTYVFSLVLPVDGAKTLTSITLPKSEGRIHLFSIAAS